MGGPKRRIGEEDYDINVYEHLERLTRSDESYKPLHIYSLLCLLARNCNKS
jgi:hypothetical protein